MRPSLPTTAWKKNSCGVNPRRYEFQAEVILSEMGKSTVAETEWDTTTFDTLLPNTDRHLRYVDV
jgi:hypothetical protein